MCLFQFLTFAERLANVNIDVIHRIDRTGSYAEVCTASNLGNALVPLIWTVSFSVFFFIDLSAPHAGSGDILLRRTDKMERPQLDGAFQ